MTMSFPGPAPNPRPPEPPAPPPPGAPPAPVLTAATRHLSAAAYLDLGFRRRVFAEVYGPQRRAAAPSNGFDLATVLHHCLTARRIDLIADGAAVALTVIAVVAIPVTTGFALLLLLNVYLGVATVRFLWQSFVLLRDRVPDASYRILGDFLALLGKWVLWFFVIGFLVIPVLLQRIHKLESNLYGSYYPDDSSISVDGGFTDPAYEYSFLFVIWSIYVGAAVWRQIKMYRLAPGAVASPRRHHGHIAELMRQQGGNITVYSGFRPFVGSGEELETQGFAIRLAPRDSGMLEWRDEPPEHPAEPSREFDDAPFTAVDLVDHLRAAMGALVFQPALGSAPERGIPNLIVEDRLFVAGTEASRVPTDADPGFVRHVVRHPLGPVRHYLSCRVVSWEGELVTSVYVHVAVQGRTLYLEISSWGLPPCDDRYRQVDDIRNAGVMPVLRAIWTGLTDTPALLAGAPNRLVRAAVDGLGMSGDDSGASAPVTRGFDYGARWSMREHVAATPRVRFQLEDIFKYKRILERRILATCYDFLESRGVDTSEYRQRQTALLNNGVIISGNRDSSFGPITGTAGAIGQ